MRINPDFLSKIRCPAFSWQGPMSRRFQQLPMLRLEASISVSAGCIEIFRASTIPQSTFIVELNSPNCCPTRTISTHPKNPVDVNERKTGTGTATDAVNKDFHSHWYAWLIRICFLIRTPSAASLFIAYTSGRQQAEKTILSLE